MKISVIQFRTDVRKGGTTMKKNMKRAAAMAMSLALAVSSVGGVMAYEAPAAEEQNPAVMGIFDKLPYTDVHVYDWFYPAVRGNEEQVY